MTKPDTFTEMRDQAARGLVRLAALHASGLSEEQLLLDAKFVINDIIQATSMAQVDCINNGLNRGLA